MSEPTMVEIEQERLDALERAADALRALCLEGITIDNANEAQEAIDEVAEFYDYGDEDAEDDE